MIRPTDLSLGVTLALGLATWRSSAMAQPPQTDTCAACHVDTGDDRLARPAAVKLGGLIRSIRACSANLMIFTLFVHLFSVLLLKASRPPCEITWMAGAGLMGLALGFGFTG